MLTKIQISEKNKSIYPELMDVNAKINVLEFDWFASKVDDSNAQISFIYNNHFILGYSKRVCLGTECYRFTECVLKKLKCMYKEKKHEKSM